MASSRNGDSLCIRGKLNCRAGFVYDKVFATMTLKIRPKEMAKEIRQIQEARNWSSVKTMAYFGLSHSTFSRWKNGFCGPSLDTYVRVIARLEKVRAEDAEAAAAAKKKK